ncbi:hypothetical protein FB45DRAFT_933726 [Roridomyces roridus]|uniref:Uncharacterized protein n=1 Tax=Roridomyces roridus TaxID=1738132 RepID=A0AAD7FFN2_9AGAR|nr:hypothetical protein FB45DRAFT_933726 [Roridomyces roridus]
MPLQLPVVSPRTRALLDKLLAQLARILRHVKWGRSFVTLLVLLNMRSWPLVWHLRVFAPIYISHARIMMYVRLPHIFSPKRMRDALDNWLENGEPGVPLGQHPLHVVRAYRSWVGPDDGDFNMHMSNSSYGRALDNARFQFAAAVTPNIYRSLGWMPLAATHYHFIREIPLFGTYEVRTSIGGWDNKWIWLVSRFVKPPKNSKRRANQTTSPFANGTSNGRTPNEVGRTILSQASKTPEPDGALLYTVAVSQLCYKHGRITVPPALVIAAHGMTTSPTSPPSAPPYWSKIRPLVLCADGMPQLKKFYRGGWRDVPEGERWWEDAMRGLEDEIVAREEVFGGLKMRLERVREMLPGTEVMGVGF